MEQGTETWFGRVGNVGMPYVACVAKADGLSILDDVGNAKNFWMPRQQVLAQNVNHQRPKAATKRNMLLGRDVLCAEYQQALAFEEGAAHGGESLIVERSRQIEVDDLAAERRVETVELKNCSFWHFLHSLTSHYPRTTV